MSVLLDLKRLVLFCKVPEVTKRAEVLVFIIAIVVASEAAVQSCESSVRSLLLLVVVVLWWSLLVGGCVLCVVSCECKSAALTVVPGGGHDGAVL